MIYVNLTIVSYYIINIIFTKEYLQFNSLDKDRVSGSSWILNLPDYGTKPSPRQGHCMLYYENTLILHGGVGDNNSFNDDKFYQYKLDYKSWSILNITGTTPGYRAFHTMSFIKQSSIIIFGGKSSNEKSSEYTINNETYKIELKENNSSSIFIAGVFPSSRYGHASSSCDDEIIFTGGLDNVYCPMEVYSLTEIELDENNTWVYEQKKQSNEQLLDKDYIFETAKNTIILYKKQLEALELKNVEINKKHSELYNILTNYRKKELEESISTNMKKNELKERKQQIESEQRTLSLEHNELREYNNLYNQYIEILRSRCLVIYEYLSDAVDSIKEMDDIVNLIDKSENRSLLFANIDMDSLIFKRKSYKEELESFLMFFKDVSILENEIYEEIKLFENDIKERFKKFYYLKTDDMIGLDFKNPMKIIDEDNKK